MIRFPLSFLLTALGMLFISGCGDDNPATTSNETITWRRPGIGSTFRYAMYNATDSLGRNITATRPQVTVVLDSVIGLDASYKGIDSLVSIREGSSTTYIDYRSNGDIAVIEARPGTVSNEWLVLPVGSRGTVEQAVEYDTFDVGAGTIYYRGSSSATYAGSDTVMIGTESIQTHRIDVVEHQRHINGSDTTISSNRLAFWVAPSIGYLARRVIIPRSGSSTTDYQTLRLGIYSLK